jgi:hypothetical protein
MEGTGEIPHPFSPPPAGIFGASRAEALKLGDGSTSFRNKRCVGLSRAIHSPTVFPNLYAGISEGGEQAVSTGPRFTVGPTRNHVELCDAVG